jgi:hypothetical protein
MSEARSRNQNILLSGLIWGLPGWAATVEEGVFTNASIDFQISWLQGLKSQWNVSVDSIGVGYNENDYNTGFMKKFKRRLLDAGLGHVQTIAADQVSGLQG